MLPIGTVSKQSFHKQMTEWALPINCLQMINKFDGWFSSEKLMNLIVSYARFF